MEDRAPNALKNIFVGLIVGVTSMLPGISGATMCVVFNIYERLIRDLADLRTYLKKDIRFILLLAIGAVIGVLLCARILDGVLDEYPVEALMFFIGLIAGQLIPIYKDVKSEGEGRFDRKATSAFVIGLGIMMIMVVFNLLGEGKNIEVGHDMTGMILMLIVGIIVAVSAILPGLSHSTILVVCGLMDAFIAVFSDLDLVLMIPMALGIIGGALGFSKIIHNALERHHFHTIVFILGLTAGSIVVIAVTVAGEVDELIDVLAGAALLVIGFLLSIGSMKLGSKVNSRIP